MPKPIVRPKVNYYKDVYMHYAQKLLQDHPLWWGKYHRPLKLKNCWIYTLEDGQVILKMSWPLFKEVIERFFHGAKEAIIQGEALHLGNRLGKIRAARIERNFAKPVVNWGETYKQKLKDPLTGKLVRIYYTDDDYCRIRWDKTGMVPGERSYNFTPAHKNMSTGKGFKKEFIRALQADPLLKYKYKFFPRYQPKPSDPCNTPSVLLNP